MEKVSGFRVLFWLILFPAIIYILWNLYLAFEDEITNMIKKVLKLIIDFVGAVLGLLLILFVIYYTFKGCDNKSYNTDHIHYERFK